MEGISRSPEHAAVAHILAAPAISGRTRRYVGADDFDWAGLLAESESMSGGEALLVRIADELWNAEKRVGLWEIVRRLDAANFERVVEALRLGRTAPAGWLGLAGADGPELGLEERAA